MSARLRALAWSTTLGAAVFAAAVALGMLPRGAPATWPASGDRLFEIKRIWDVELSFSAAEWAAMELLRGM